MTENEYAELVRTSTNFEDLKEVSKQFYESQGLIIRSRNVRGGGNSGSDEITITPTSARPAPPKPPSELDAYEGQLLRKAVRLPDGSVQLLTAFSQTGMDQLEMHMCGSIAEKSL